MSSRFKTTKPYHKNTLQRSTQDTVSLCRAVQERFLDLLGSYERIKQEELIPPQELDAAMMLWRTLAVRHKKNDFRNTSSELQALKEVAQWTLRENATLRNQDDPSVEFSDE